MLVLRVVLLVLLKRLQLICEVAQLGIVSSVFGRLDFRLILLDVFVDGFHGSSLRFREFKPACQFCCLAFLKP